MSFLNQFVVDPRDFDDDDDDWLNDDFDDFQQDQNGDMRCPNLKTIHQQQGSNREENDGENVSDSEEDDGFQEAMQLRQVGFYDADGNSYSEVQVTTGSIHLPGGEEAGSVAEMTERLVDIALDEDVDGDAHTELSDAEITLLDEMYKKHVQRRIAEANQLWGCFDASNANHETGCQGGATNGNELQIDRATKVQFSGDVQYFNCADLPFDTEEMTAHELMLLKEKSDTVNCVEVNLRIIQSTTDEDLGPDTNEKSTTNTNAGKDLDAQICKNGEYSDSESFPNPRTPSSQLLKFLDVQISSKAEFYIPPNRQATAVKFPESDDSGNKLKGKVNPILKAVLDPKVLSMLCKAPSRNTAIIRELNVALRENMDIIQRAGLHPKILSLLDELSRVKIKKKKTTKVTAPNNLYRSTVSSQMRVAEIQRYYKSDKKPSTASSKIKIKSLLGSTKVT